MVEEDPAAMETSRGIYYFYGLESKSLFDKIKGIDNTLSKWPSTPRVNLNVILPIVRLCEK